MTFRTVAELIGALALVILGTGALINSDNSYFCEVRQIAMNCDSLSSTGKTCYNGEVGNKICYEGWVKFSDVIEPVVTVVNPIEVDTIKPIKFNGDFTTSPDGKTCYLQGNLRRGVSCET